MIKRATYLVYALLIFIGLLVLRPAAIRAALTQATAPPTNTPRAAASPTGTVASVPVSSTLSPATKNPLPVVVLPAQRTERPQVTAIPTHVPRVKTNGNDILNIALLGTDADVDPTDPSFRTDAIVIVSINRTTNSVSMLSLPRDLFVYIPSLGMQRINDAFVWGQAVHWEPGGGFGLLQQTILYNFGIPVHYYAKIGFGGFKNIVDTLGGVDVAVDCPISDLRFQGKVDAQQTPVYEPYILHPGYYKMDGSLALWYARMRHSTSDFDRNRRQQQILRAIWRTARDQQLLGHEAELWGQLTKIVDTNLQLPDVLGLVPVALSLQPGSIRGFTMYKDIQMHHWTTPAGDDVQLPDPAAMSRLLTDFYTPPTNQLGSQAVTVEVLNGSQIPDLDKVAADKLAWEGFDARAKGATDAANKTVIYDFTGNASPGSQAALLKTLGLKPGQVISQADPNRSVDFRVVLERDYNSCTAPGFGR